MSGPAPKPPEQRARRNVPAGGEWREIPRESGLKTPKMPPAAKGQPWRAATRRAWGLWWSDGAATRWGPAQLEQVETLCRLFDRLARGETKHAAEIRLRQDGLGLTPKGKREHRWRVLEGEVPVAREVRSPASHRREHLKVV